MKLVLLLLAVAALWVVTDMVNLHRRRGELRARMTRLGLLAVLLLALPLAARAQVPSFQAPPLQRPTYSASVVGLAAPQTGAGDLACISGFAANSLHPAGVVRVKGVQISGVNTTAQTSTFELVTHSAADTGGTPGGSHSTVTITDASPGVISWSSNGLSNGTPIVLTTTGSLPTGLTAGQVYYVVAAATNTFELAATPGGAAINTSSAGSGTQTAYAQPLGVPLDQTNSPAYATVTDWTAIPTLGTVVGPVEAASLGFAAATASTPPNAVWTWDPIELQQEVILRGAAQQLCVNAPNAFTTNGPTLNIRFRWTEQ
jgi:hypothetical protein